MLLRFPDKGELPLDGQYVLAHLSTSNLTDKEHPSGPYWNVLKFVRGLSDSDREKLDDSDPRKVTYTFADQGFNNKRPYGWDIFGPGSHFGQDIDAWCEIPDHFDEVDLAKITFDRPTSSIESKLISGGIIGLGLIAAAVQKAYSFVSVNDDKESSS